MPDLLDALARLNRIGATVNRLTPDDLVQIKSTLRLIVESTVDVLPGSSAVIYAWDAARGCFEPETRTAAGLGPETPQVQAPRAGGFGSLAVARHARVLSYEEPGLSLHPAWIASGSRSMVCYPLGMAGELLGALYVYLLEERRFSELELLMLDLTANYSAAALSLAHQYTLAQTEQTRRERELRRLRRAGMLISSRSSLKDTLEAILSMALEITDAIYGIFRLVDRSGQNLITQAIAGDHLGQPAVEELPISETSVMGTVAVRREPVVISDLREEPWRKIYYPFDHEIEMRAEVAVPLIGASGRLEGVLNLESPQVNAFSKEDRYLLQILATQAVVAIQEVRLLDALQEIIAELSLRTAQQAHQLLVERACDLLNVPVGLIWLVQKDQLALAASTLAGLRGELIPLEGGSTGQAVTSRSPVALLDAANDAQFTSPALAALNGRGSALIVPVVNSDEDRVIGAFSVYTAAGDSRNFGAADWDKKVLTILGQYAALAVQNAAHLEALREAEDRRATTETFAAIGDIAANLLHRLNNKIGTIPVRVEGIQDKCETALLNEPYLANNLSEIQRSAAEAMQIVRESMFHLRPIQLAPVSVAASLEEAFSMAKIPPAVQIECSGLDNLPAVQAGAQRLSLVFSNLIDNAVDAMEGHGAIFIRGAQHGRWVEIRVTDTGPGISPELHERIFEFNYSSRASSQPGKLGFGLWWVKSLAARFGGRVTLESDGRHGATFILTLPQATEDV